MSSKYTHELWKDADLTDRETVRGTFAELFDLAEALGGNGLIDRFVRACYEAGWEWEGLRAVEVQAEFESKYRSREWIELSVEAQGKTPHGRE